MPHQVIGDDDTYHLNDSRDIHLTVYQENVGGRRQNLEGAEIEWIVKEDPLDDDADALLTKTTSDGSIEIDDARNGEAIIYLEEGDTDGFLTVTKEDEDGNQKEERQEQRTLHQRVRVTDDRGNRITVCHGEWVIHI